MKTWLLIVPLILLTACSHMTVTRQEDAHFQEPKEFTMHSFLLGFVPGAGPTSTQDFCPGGRIEALDLRMSGLDVVMTLATVGLYVPHKAKVQCGPSLERQATAEPRR